MVRLVNVRVLALPFLQDRSYTYTVPESLKNEIVPGTFVTVPFGFHNKYETALVESAFDSIDDEDSLKTVIRMSTTEYSLSEKMMEMVDYLRENTFCSTGDAIKVMVPPGAFELSNTYFNTNPEFDCSSLRGRKKDIFELINNNEGIDFDSIKKKIDASNTTKLIFELTEMGAISGSVETKSASDTQKEYICYGRADADVSVLDKPRTPESHRQIYDRVSNTDGIPANQLVKEGFSMAQINAVAKKGFITLTKIEKLRIPYTDIPVNSSINSLSSFQQKAFEQLSEYLDEPNADCALLYGVTGSGKTAVILKLVEKAVNSGKTAIVLVPEIALTWQSVSIFSSKFGDRLAVINSSLSDGEKADAYRRIVRGDVSVVLGTRSALFAPLDNIGIIVIDEEQEHTYKSDMSPKYSSIEVAKMRVKQDNALLLLSSATPSVESYYRAKTGIYKLVHLPERYNGAELPKTEISDLKSEGTPGKIIGETLAEELRSNYENNRQSVLFLNRRGYSGGLICKVCGSIPSCPHCSVSMSYHKTISGGMLVCHMCGYRKSAPSICPTCGSNKISFTGFGTQAVEEEIKNILPNAVVLRMDADTTQTKKSRERIIEDFSTKKADVLVGTQMITKGHNFPGVTLAAAVLADSGMFSSDFRAGERTFSLLTQLVGRSGRGSDEGKAIIQTYKPDSVAIQLGAKQDYDSFFENEILLRKAHNFPPFCDLAVITFTSDNEEILNSDAMTSVGTIKRIWQTNFSKLPITVFGPFAPPIYMLKNKYRLRVVIKFKNKRESRIMLGQILKELSEKKSSTVSIDINPSDT